MKRPFTIISILFLGLVSVLQLARVLLGWEVSINGAVIPLWASVVACVVTGGLSVMTWRESHL